MTGNGPVRIVDSHTGGEPTRVVIAGGPTHAPASTAALAANVTVLSQYAAADGVAVLFAGANHTVFA